jgi:hypothetical protein
MGIIRIDQNSVNLVHKIDSAGHSKIPNLFSTQVRHAEAIAGSSAHAVNPASDNFLFISDQHSFGAMRLGVLESAIPVPLRDVKQVSAVRDGRLHHPLVTPPPQVDPVRRGDPPATPYQMVEATMRQVEGHP